jgi:hypothetical protein
VRVLYSINAPSILAHFLEEEISECNVCNSLLLKLSFKSLRWQSNLAE